MRDHEIGRDRRKVEGLADEVAQRDNEIVRVHGMPGHQLPDGGSASRTGMKRRYRWPGTKPVCETFMEQAAQDLAFQHRRQ
ncbi:hypothetical protein ASD99_08545 [Mesorhizobium sp. Root695]|nr:hypothetical protein ASD99_08545 [Mesorhizobium sp. Root695]